MNVPGVPVPVPIPVARMDREPHDEEELLFDSYRAGVLHPDLYAIDIPKTRALARKTLEAIEWWWDHQAGVP